MQRTGMAQRVRCHNISGDRRNSRRDGLALVAIARQFANRCDSGLNSVGGEEDLPDMRANFKNGLRLVGREIEAMFLKQSQMVRRIMAGLSRCIQRDRPGRNYRRE